MADERGRGGLREPEQRGKIHGEGALQNRGRDRLERGERKIRGVVHDHVEPAEVGFDVGDEALDLRVLRHIGLVRAPRATLKRETLYRFRSRVDAQIRNRHRGAARGERLGDAAPDALRAAGYQHHFAGEITHVHRMLRRAVHRGCRVTLSTCASAPTGKFDSVSNWLP